MYASPESLELLILTLTCYKHRAQDPDEVRAAIRSRPAAIMNLTEWLISWYTNWSSTAGAVHT